MNYSETVKFAKSTKVTESPTCHHWTKQNLNIPHQAVFIEISLQVIPIPLVILCGLSNHNVYRKKVEFHGFTKRIRTWITVIIEQGSRFFSKMFAPWSSDRLWRGLQTIRLNQLFAKMSTAGGAVLLQKLTQSNRKTFSCFILWGYFINMHASLEVSHPLPSQNSIFVKVPWLIAGVQTSHLDYPRNLPNTSPSQSIHPFLPLSFSLSLCLSLPWFLTSTIIPPSSLHYKERNQKVG